MVQITQSEQQKEKRFFKNKEILRNNIKHINVPIMEVPEEREKGAETMFEKIMAENFANLRKETDI